MEPIIGYTLAEIANSVALQLDPPHPPSIQLKDTLSLWIVLPDNAIVQIASATQDELHLYLSHAITHLYIFEREEAYTRKRREFLSSTLDVYAVWYALSEMLQDNCALLLYRSHEDAQARRDAVVRPKRERQKVVVEVVENHVTRDDLQRIVEKCGFQFRIIVEPHVQYFAIKPRTKGTRFRRIYLCSDKTIVKLTEEKVREMLKDEGV